MEYVNRNQNKGCSFESSKGTNPERKSKIKMKTTIEKLAKKLENVNASSYFKTYSMKNFEVSAIMQDGQVKYAFKVLGNIDENGNPCYNSIKRAIDLTNTSCSDSELKSIVDIDLKFAAELEQVNKENRDKNYQPDGDEEDLDLFSRNFTHKNDITDMSRENDGR